MSFSYFEEFGRNEFRAPILGFAFLCDLCDLCDLCGFAVSRDWDHRFVGGSWLDRGTGFVGAVGAVVSIDAPVLADLRG